MSTTNNYGLYITSNDEENCFDFVQKMGGETDSNMIKIDTILGQKADQSIQIKGLLVASAWEGDVLPCTQVITVAGLGENQNGSIAISHDATLVQKQEAREAMLDVIGQSGGKLIVSASGKKPSIDIPFIITLLG